MGRPLKYDTDTKRALLVEYDRTPKGQRVELARHLKVTLTTLIVYISQWRKELNNEDIENADDQAKTVDNPEGLRNDALGEAQ